jgi:hypothetical protein
MVGDESKYLTVDLTDHGAIGVANTSGTRCDLCEDTLQVRRRS